MVKPFYCVLSKYKWRGVLVARAAILSRDREIPCPISSIKEYTRESDYYDVMREAYKSAEAYGIKPILIDNTEAIKHIVKSY